MRTKPFVGKKRYDCSVWNEGLTITAADGNMWILHEASTVQMGE